jgi:hypothetical protein
MKRTIEQRLAAIEAYIASLQEQDRRHVSDVNNFLRAAKDAELIVRSIRAQPSCDKCGFFHGPSGPCRED